MNFLKRAEPGIFFVIDFDGTVVEPDIVDLILQRFAKPQWVKIEEKWERGEIGAKECLAMQIALIDAPLTELLAFVDDTEVENTFPAFVRFIESLGIPSAIVSDGFSVFIKRILAAADIRVPVFANDLVERKGKLFTVFPHNKPGCGAGTCKCRIADELDGDRRIVLVGDGRSDFCLAESADIIFAKKGLADFCRGKSIVYHEFKSFQDIKAVLENGLKKEEEPFRKLVGT